MGVDLQGDFQRSVTHEVLRCFYIDTSVVKHRTVSVAKVIRVNLRHLLPTFDDVLPNAQSVVISSIEHVFQVVHERIPVFPIGALGDRFASGAFAHQFLVRPTFTQQWSEGRDDREEAGMPSDIASWGATAFSGEGSNAVKTGVQAWVEYGVDTYPKEITTETFNHDDTSYIRQDGVAHPLDEQDYAAINELYRQKYEQVVKLHGRITSPEAAKELEKALSKARTEARNEYMSKGYFDRERGEK